MAYKHSASKDSSEYQGKAHWAIEGLTDGTWKVSARYFTKKSAVKCLSSYQKYITDREWRLIKVTA